jgi:hypothetical protein
MKKVASFTVEITPLIRLANLKNGSISETKPDRQLQIVYVMLEKPVE